MAHQIEQVGVIECASAVKGARFNDEIGFGSIDDFLIRPKVERALEHPNAEEMRIFPSMFSFGGVVMKMKRFEALFLLLAPIFAAHRAEFLANRQDALRG